MYKHLQHCQSQLDAVQAIDFYLARQITQALDALDDDILLHSIMACSSALREGHTCLKLDTKSNDASFWQNKDEDKPGYQFPDRDSWHQHLSALNIKPDDGQTLVYEHRRLYLRRYWQFEVELANILMALISKKAVVDKGHGKENAKQILQQLFPDTASDELDWQKIAVANALMRQFTIIAGGPGTGKTFTVTKVLSALQALASNNLHIAMVAPTGKAAQRLNESIQKAKAVLLENNLATIETLDSIPDSASTLHRLLGVIPGSHDFRFAENKKLPYDVVLVDEISMIDLALMTRLMRAIDADCRIIMLGDADQLPSVAAGSVLSDLTPRQTPAYSLESHDILADLTGLDLPVQTADHLNLDYLTVLQKSHRFDGVGEIGRLASQVIKGSVENSWQILKQGEKQIEQIKEASFKTWLEQMVERYYVPLFEIKGNDEQAILQAFNQLNQFRLLAATRAGHHGVDNINDIVENYLQAKGLITGSKEFYPGRPIMITENHYGVKLYNGDTGLIWQQQGDEQDDMQESKLQAFFPENDSLRRISLARLPHVETVYAMTIHKTQGSEFTHVALVLPEIDSQILSRELLYTGITRASKRLSIWAEQNIWRIAVSRKVQRYSGLEKRLFDEL
ncbi:exodeoxyribonuclease V subunit alpha [sulfur-oxidizing endosymbiont of Gigantopelta aegis]|uniref:exodeoxyribonuclease V subunit alpha n=1 Tax=sulfur-oxidizing endosymbiont of Gigantopelta aegis TaxID=2794934 RepID=UPI0018DE897A|nr:exodeoxyribonuclease V subunit alpha [sulfur-oxidizing endosymbiont of Gigantopelta aegis]